jgi:hypothetical protein
MTKRLFGFSTGAIAFGDFRHALRMLERVDVNAVELSALRLNELQPLVESLDTLALQRYEYVSLHAPGKFSSEEEPAVVQQLMRVADRGWYVIVHPDSLINYRLWLPLQERLCFENMDKRKPIGRTASELWPLFDRFKNAHFCFDIGHAHQIDRTMTEACVIAQKFKHKMRQIHVSEVNTRSEHVAISATLEFALSKVIQAVDETAPVIIESVIPESRIANELACIKEAFVRRSPREFAMLEWG